MFTMWPVGPCLFLSIPKRGAKAWITTSGEIMLNSPAVLAVTRNPLIVYSSNVMAMLGLRSLYFVLSDSLDRLRYLRHGLAAVLVFTGAKMIGSEWVHISPGVSVGIIGLVLGVMITVSTWARRGSDRFVPTRLAR